MIFENPGTTVRKRPGFDYWILQFWNDSRRRVLSQEKGLTGESIEKEVVEKMEGFLGCSLLKHRQ